MFEIKKEVVDIDNDLYVLLRAFKDTGNKFPIRPTKKFYGADKIVHKNGYYFLLEKIIEPEILEEITNK